MTSFKVSLPTDVPRKRMGVFEDLLDPIPCDAERSQQWKASLTVFRHDPADDVLPYADQTVSYAKVMAAVAPYAQATRAAARYGSLVLVDELEEALP